MLNVGLRLQAKPTYGEWPRDILTPGRVGRVRRSRNPTFCLVACSTCPMSDYVLQAKPTQGLFVTNVVRKQRIAAPISGIQATGHVAVEAAVGPSGGLVDVTMLYWVEVNVVGVIMQIAFISKGVFPEAFLPDRGVYLAIFCDHSFE